ncbi:surface protein (macronuclear) [Tetrahymena thermophila SB210]|uniref:Surface protein n=1 Tax=Tetrahymena thermophila (strain SB210) TaxID=312017 RepID=Q234X6_TETTS|nr:surface protein [Tetrahymena thermophila SB210]EAR91877.2 surface protein [Tetrahymena thermophila SB210]|eukprot:XP_001012122.2 surface protein [Tetrahymena thermophila SB210]
MNQSKDDQLLEFSNQLYYFIPSQQNYYLIDINNLESFQDQQTYTCGNPLSMLTSQGLKTNYFQSNNLYVRIATKQDDLTLNPLTITQQNPQKSINTSYSDIMNLDPQTRLVAMCWVITGQSVWWFYQTDKLPYIQSTIPCQNQPQNQPIVFQNYFIVDQSIYSLSKSSQSISYKFKSKLPKQYLPSHAFNYSQRFYKEKRTQIVIEQNNNENIYLFMSMDYLVCQQNNSYVNQQGECQTCNQNQIFSNNQCSSCPQGTFYQNQQCSPCSSNCTQCDNFTKCNTCASGYYLSNSNLCVLCPNNSSWNNSSCDCNNNYFKQIINSTTLEFQCVKCSDPCKECTSSTICTACYSQYYLNGNTCTNCQSPCLTCTSASECQTCQDGYYISGSQCMRCVSPCLKCSSSSSCSSCSFGYFLSGTTCQQCDSICTSQFCSTCNENLICPSCFDGYFLDKNSCQKCLQNCAQCNDSQTCTQCLKGYNLYDNLCLTSEQCPSGCKLCQDNFSCQTCLDGYVKQNQQCIKCSVENCSFCDQQQRCFQCKSGYKLLNNSQICVKDCGVGHYLSDNNECLACDQTCFTCKGPTDTDCIICKTRQKQDII